MKAALKRNAGVDFSYRPAESISSFAKMFGEHLEDVPGLKLFAELILLKAIRDEKRPLPSCTPFLLDKVRHLLQK
jgi:hypothetical protein